MNRREFLAAAAGMGLALGADGMTAAVAQPPAAQAGNSAPRRIAKTTRLFKSPTPHPNGLALSPEGLWIAQQWPPIRSAATPGGYLPIDKDEAAWLVDWDGKPLKTVITKSRNTSGMAYGNGCVWMGANIAPQGFFQTDMNARLVRHLQIPLGPADNGGGCHGAQWHEGKLWIVANRIRGNLRVDPETWTPEFIVPIYATPEKPRWHDITFDKDGYMWQISGNSSTSYAEGKPGLIKYDPATGAVLETVEFAPGSCDPHGLEFHDGALISCDAGEHPGWPPDDSPTTGYIFRIDLV
jgi:sugar lactone lactonase YvrE